MKRALLVYPTHENGREAVERYLKSDMDAVCYPGRTTKDTESMAQNCWNVLADEAERIGLPVVKTVCFRCSHRRDCNEHGYLAQLARAKEAKVAICTHKRAEYMRFGELASGRDYISIHENPIDLLRPKLSISEFDLLQAQFVLNQLLSDPKFLDWFGTATKTDDLGNEYHSDELAIRKTRLYDFCRFLADLLDALVVRLGEVESNTEWKPSAIHPLPKDIEWLMFQTTKSLKARFSGPAWRFVLSAASGQIYAATIMVQRKIRKGIKPKVEYLDKSIVAVQNNRPPPSASTWFNDATLTADRLSAILNYSVQDETPEGRIDLRKKAIQILRDITRRAKPRIVANVLRGVLADRPQFAQVGIICHRPHLVALKQLGAKYEARIVKSTYFGSGDERSSNDWHEKCDLIIVVGTPRVPPSAIAEYLVQVGEIGAACRQTEWGKVFWHGETESGELIKVEARGYEDEIWRRAHQDLVRAQIVQAVGRGRGILEEGCEVIVLSNEECGLKISDTGMEALNETSSLVWRSLIELCAKNPNKYLIGKFAHKSQEIASHSGLRLRLVQLSLQMLERRGLVRKLGERGGWMPVEQPMGEAMPCPAP